MDGVELENNSGKQCCQDHIFIYQQLFHWCFLRESNERIVFKFQFYCKALQNERCSATLGITFTFKLRFLHPPDRTLGITFTFKLCFLHPPEIRIRTGAVY